MKSLQLKMPATTLKGHLQKVEEENQEPRKKNDLPPGESYISALGHQLSNIERHQQKLHGIPQGPLGSSHEMAQLVSNKTHYSPHDPDACISVKPGKAQKLNYRCSMAVDTAEGVISYMQADFADGRDSQYLPETTRELQGRLKDNELTMANLLAGTGYSNGSLIQFSETERDYWLGARVWHV